MNWFQVSAIVALSLTFSFGVAEVLFRISGIVGQIQTGWGWHDSPLRHMQPSDASAEANSLGLRGQDFVYTEDDYVILLVGDSQVEAPAVPRAAMPETLLQKALTHRVGRPVRVFSLAASGWGQDQQLLVLQRYFQKWRADLILLWPTLANDYWENAFPDRNVARFAGPIKPSFRLNDDTLEGPFFSEPFYLHGSAVLQLLEQSLRGTLPRQRLLDTWMASIPKEEVAGAASRCHGTVEIPQNDYFHHILELDPDQGYTILTREDLEHGRSHFSPQTTPPRGIERYQKALTRRLAREIKELTTKHGARFRVIYPVREDIDRRTQSIRCIRTVRGNLYQYAGNHIALLRETMPEQDLLIFPVGGGNELVVSRDDRHFGIEGNRRAMEELVITLVRTELLSACNQDTNGSCSLRSSRQLPNASASMPVSTKQ